MTQLPRTVDSAPFITVHSGVARDIETQGSLRLRREVAQGEALEGTGNLKHDASERTSVGPAMRHWQKPKQSRGA